MSWSKFVQWWNDIANRIGSWFMTQDEAGINPLTRITVAIIVIIVGRLLVKLIMNILRKTFGVKSKLTVDVSVKTFTLSLLSVLLNLALAFFVLWILKVNLSSFASILSAGTVAVGLSLQDLISSFAAGIVILQTKHFKTGDYISIVHAIGTCEGTVSSVGLITTTLVTVDNQKIIVPNNKISQGVITNYTGVTTRRLVLDIGVDYNTDIDKVRSVILDVFNNDARVLKEPSAYVVVTNLDEYSIKISARCFVRNENYWDCRFQLLENILLAFRANNILIPYKRLVVENYSMKEQTPPSINVK